MFTNVAKKQSNVGIRRHYNIEMIMLLHLRRVDDVMCFKRISFFVSGSKEKVGGKCG